MNRFAKGLICVSTTCFCLLGVRSQTLAATFDISTATGIFTPSYRGAANTTWFGWETFDDPTVGDNLAPEDEDWVVDDQVPDIGSYGGSQARILGHNLPFNLNPLLSGVDHISSTRNIYTGGSTLDETVTAPTNGSVGTGFTTIIVQGVTAFGPLGGQINFTQVAGVSPIVVQENNAIGSGQFWAKYEIPGNALTYDFTLTSSALDDDFIGENVSITRLVVDTLWSSTGYASDVAAVPEPASSAMLLVGSMGAIYTARRYRTRKGKHVVS